MGIANSALGAGIVGVNFMNAGTAATHRIVIVGGGISGLAASVRLVQAGLPVTLLEASELGSAASTRNQGWLHSGGLFALASPEYARTCYASLQQTLKFCSDCVEPQIPSMAFLFSRPDTLVKPWKDAWNSAGIPYEEVSIDGVCAKLPGLERTRIQHAYQLPDRAMRADALLAHLAAAAQNAGVDIRTGTHVKQLSLCDEQVRGVVTSKGEEVPAQLVILAGGATGFDLCGEFLRDRPGCQSEVELVCLKRHLVSLRQEVGRLPFCVVDADGLNHIPHPPTSVFGVELWDRVRTPDDRPDPHQVERICGRIRDFFPSQPMNAEGVHAWAGTTMQALRTDQIEPGKMLWPAVIDHARHAPRIANLISIFPGRATLWTDLAEDTRRLVLSKLDVQVVSTAHPPWVTS
jgi:glycine/D-amino acid oxidase-like deaminating enzyme